MGILKSTNSGLYRKLTHQMLIDLGYHLDEVKLYSIGVCQYTSPITKIFSIFYENGVFYTKSIGSGDNLYIIEDLKVLSDIEHYFSILRTGYTGEKQIKEITKFLQQIHKHEYKHEYSKKH